MMENEISYAEIDSSNVIHFIEMCVRFRNKKHVLDYICEKKIRIPEWSYHIIASRHFELFKWAYECIGNYNFLRMNFKALLYFSPVKVFEFLDNIDEFYPDKKMLFTSIVLCLRVDLIKWIMNKYPLERIFEDIEVEDFFIEILDVILDRILDDNTNNIRENRLFNLIRYFKHVCPELDFSESQIDLLAMMAEYKFWKIFHWLRKQLNDVSEELISQLILHNKIELLEEYYKSNPELFTEEIFSKASESKHSNIIEWMLKINKK